MDIKIVNWWYFSLGFFVLLFLFGSYFIEVDVGDFKSVVLSSLLGVLIFYSPWVLGIYILIGLGLLFLGLKIKKRKINERNKRKVSK
jgi:predicted membrane protein